MKSFNCQENVVVIPMLEIYPIKKNILVKTYFLYNDYGYLKEIYTLIGNAGIYLNTVYLKQIVIRQQLQKCKSCLTSLFELSLYPDMRPHPHERALPGRRRGGLIMQGPLHLQIIKKFPLAI